jgi:hypothetical protein
MDQAARGIRDFLRRAERGIGVDETERILPETATLSIPVIPAKAGIQSHKCGRCPWVPAFAGMTETEIVIIGSHCSESCRFIP